MELRQSLNSQCSLTSYFRTSRSFTSCPGRFHGHRILCRGRSLQSYPGHQSMQFNVILSGRAQFNVMPRTSHCSLSLEVTEVCRGSSSLPTRPSSIHLVSNLFSCTRSVAITVCHLNLILILRIPFYRCVGTTWCHVVAL